MGHPELGIWRFAGVEPFPREGPAIRTLGVF
jgi:hypothetical protein